MLELLVLAWMLGMAVYAFFKIGARAAVLLLAAFALYLCGAVLRSYARHNEADSYEVVSLVLKFVGVVLLVVASYKYFSKKRVSG